MRRKVAHRIIEDVRTAYWRAVSSDRLLAKLRKLERRIDKVRKDSSEISADRQTSPITAVTYARELIEIKRKIEEIERDLVIARTQLASLMNIPPGTNFKLVHPARSARDLSPDLNVPNLITQAMSNRPELREVWYQKRINQAELDAALLELLPGLQVFAGTNYDSNEFLFNSNWLSWSARASWNAMRVFQYPRKRAVVEAQDALLDERSLAVAMAIITQVHVSRIRFLQFRKEIQTANEYLNIQRQLVALLKDEAQAARVSEQTLLREELNALVAETRRDVAYASLQNAFANIYASIGIDPLPVEFTLSMPVHEVAASLRSMWIERGDHSSGATKSAQADLN
jgi:outer membrane protein TolC